ncbi:WecB/TagA/CpsF family glycosyltransferase [Microbispora triticiradicis]|uniref:WecB/TagA/CpsF family glycosyltransferase n=1 Tax=Microbispora triticiradicis TaxID=2200763 RepID=UPI001AD7B76A|nr:WecB/TagA/CpsF family glycosyltransferase [Microbispora triticiradicis]MBO4273257.1 WecB/TagA/CpsF family glycosyltransferase [Microbispora triticiradicis]
MTDPTSIPTAALDPAFAARSGRAAPGQAASAGIGAVEPGTDRVPVAGVLLDPFTEARVVTHIMAALECGEGGHLVTPNVDICRAAARDPSLRELIHAAELAVADGMPLVWASRLLGCPLPERVTGADLIWSLTGAAAARGLPVYLIGGPPGVAEAARDALCGRHPGLVVAGVHAPPYGFETSPAALAEMRGRLVATRPSLVFVGLGFPRQDRLIAALRPDLPGTWFVGCGAAIAFAAGSVRRAPGWMGDHGLEWLFRLISEPHRLARRYLVDDLPFALRLLTRALLHRALTRRPPGRRRSP